MGTFTFLKHRQHEPFLKGIGVQGIGVQGIRVQGIGVQGIGVQGIGMLWSQNPFTLVAKPVHFGRKTRSVWSQSERDLRPKFGTKKSLGQKKFGTKNVLVRKFLTCHGPPRRAYIEISGSAGAVGRRREGEVNVR